MLRLALLFLIVAFIAAVFGSGLIAGVALDAARILFILFFVLAIIVAVMGYRGQPTNL